MKRRDSCKRHKKRTVNMSVASLAMWLKERDDADMTEEVFLGD